jgi:hypothetical protein
MALGKFNDGQHTSPKQKQYAASATPRNLVADSPDTATCARKIKILGGAGSFTNTKDGADQNMGTFGPFAQGDEHTGSISEVTSADQAFIAYW